MKGKWREILRDFALMTLGVTVMVCGVYFFKIPNGFSVGGITGLATILGHLQSVLTPGQMIPIMNIGMLLIGFIFLGKSTGIKTVYCSLLFSFLSWGAEKVFPLSAPLTNQPLLELLYGIGLTAFGSALLFYCCASSGGTDITALILKKYTHIEVGKALLLSDFLIAASSIFVFDLTIGMFSLFGLFIKAFLLDGVMESITECKSFLIVTTKPEEVKKYILTVMERSATCVEAKGAYTGEKKTMLITLCNRIEASRLKQFLRKVDPDAFTIITSTNEIVGRGFREV